MASWSTLGEFWTEPKHRILCPHGVGHCHPPCRWKCCPTLRVSVHYCSRGFYGGFIVDSAPQSSTLAWKIPWMEEPGRLQSMGLLRVGQDRATSLSLFTFMHWRWKWQPTPVFLPGESQGQEPCGLPSVGSHRVGHD